MSESRPGSRRRAGTSNGVDRSRSESTHARPSAATARPSEREGAFGNPVIPAEVRYSLVTKYYRLNSRINLRAELIAVLWF